jgi:hypothetical protein
MPTPLPALKLTVTDNALLVSNVTGPSKLLARISGAGVAYDTEGRITMIRAKNRTQQYINILGAFIFTSFERLIYLNVLCGFHFLLQALP